MNVQLSRRTYAITLFLILLVCYGYFMPKWADWGANSRADLVYAFGDKGVLNIDDYHENTGDKACYPGPYAADPNEINKGTCTGHYFSDKSLGPSLLALPFYMIFKAVAALPPIQRFIESGKGLGGVTDTLNPSGQAAASPEKLKENLRQGMALTFMTFFATSIPSALLGVVVFLMAARFARKDSYAFLLGLVYGLATIAFPYSNVLYQHQLSAFGTFVGFYLMWRVVYEDADLRWLWVIGVLFSFAVITEYPVVPALAIIFLWGAYKMPPSQRLQLYRVVVAAIPLGLIFAAYNYAAFNNPIPVGYEYSTNWQNVHQVGFLSLTLPNPETLIGLTLGAFRGLFFLSPVLLIGIPGLWMMWQQKPEYRSGVVTIILVILFFFTYNSSSAMWWGGNTVGPRYLVPVIPFLALPMIFAFNLWFRSRVNTIVVAVLIALSFFNVWAQTIGGQAFPPAFTDAGEQIKNPLFDYSLPLLAQGNIARNYGIIAGLKGFLSLIPLAAVLAAIYFLLPRWLSRREQHQQESARQLEQAAGGTD
jgi:hypothetical protein